MTQFAFVPFSVSTAFGPGGISTARTGFVWGALKPTGWDPAVDTNGYSLTPYNGVRMGEARAAAGVVGNYAFLCARSGSFTSMGVRHRVAGGVATNIVYTLWRNNQAIALTAVTVAANSAVEVVATFASQTYTVGTRLEVVAQVAATIADADMPEDIVVTLS